MDNHLGDISTEPAERRVGKLGEKIPTSVLEGKDFAQHMTTIRDRFGAVASDLSGTNAYRYQGQISPGIQEFVEAVLFQHYLETDEVLSPADCAELVPSRIRLGEDDYVLGLFDMTGEVMRYAITQMATQTHSSLDPSDGQPGQAGRRVLMLLQSLRTTLESLVVRGNVGLAKQISTKMNTTVASVEKVEKAVYSMTVRGREQPKGWNPGLEAPREVREVDV
jgi:hypothetical protein